MRGGLTTGAELPPFRGLLRPPTATAAHPTTPASHRACHCGLVATHAVTAHRRSPPPQMIDNAKNLDRIAAKGAKGIMARRHVSAGNLSISNRESA